MPGFTSGAFKIFIGKIPERTVPQDIRPLFEKYGKVLECDVVKNYGFVHMEDPNAGYEAIKNLNGVIINGYSVTVEEAKNKRRTMTAATTKIFVGNIPESVKAPDIRALFSRYGTVAECDLVKNYAFVHIETTDLTRLLKELNGYEIVSGQYLKVQISTSHVRQRPGMGNPQQCYKCGRSGHWSKECVRSPQSSAMTGQPQYLPDHTAYTMAQAQRTAAYTRDLYSHANSANRVLGSYSIPDPRNYQMMPEYYDPYAQAAHDYTQAAAVAAVPRREVVAPSYPPPMTTRVVPTSEYEMYTRRSPNLSNVVHYSTDTHAYDDYSSTTVPYTYPTEADSWGGYGDYSVSAMSTIPVASVDPYAAAAAAAAAATPIDTRAVTSYDGYSSVLSSAFPIADDRRNDRRDGLSRSSSRYAPY